MPAPNPLQVAEAMQARIRDIGHDYLQGVTVTFTVRSNQYPHAANGPAEDLRLEMGYFFVRNFFILRRLEWEAMAPDILELLSDFIAEGAEIRFTL